MTGETNNEKRDRILTAFHQQCENPTIEEIVEWTRRYPEFTDDIVEHAALSKDAYAHAKSVVEPTDDDMLARADSRMLNALYKARSTVAHKVEDDRRTFKQLIDAMGTSVPKLAREIDIERSILADIVNGMILLPIGERLINALVRSLNTSRTCIEFALQIAFENPRLGHAKANGPPVIIPLSFAKAIEESSMEMERKRYWLDENCNGSMD